MKTTLSIIVITTVVAASDCSAIAVEPAPYSIIELPAAESNVSTANSNATGLNELGHVVGIAEDDIHRPHAVVWIDGEIAVQFDQIPYEGPLDGNNFNAKGINIHGEVVGQGSQAAFGGYIGVSVSYQNDTGLFNPDPNQPNHGWSWAINDSSQVGFNSGSSIFIWDPIDGAREISLPGFDPDFGNQEVWEINNAGQACGAARDGYLHWQSFRYDYATDTMVNLHDPINYWHTVGYGINELGDIAGWAESIDDGRMFPMIWAADGREIEMATGDLTPAHLRATAEHINSDGTVVGSDGSVLPEPPIGWIAYNALNPAVEQATKIDLRTTLSAADQLLWTRMHPFEVNEAGQICGTGTFDGKTRGFLMTPCPADISTDGVLNFFDISAFLAAFAVQDPAADLTDDGEFNFFDISTLLGMFTNGCP